MRDAALAGLGLALLPSFIVQRDLQAGRLVQVLSEARATDDQIHALYPHARRASVKVQVLCDFLCSRHRYRIAGRSLNNWGASAALVEWVSRL